METADHLSIPLNDLKKHYLVSTSPKKEFDQWVTHNNGGLWLYTNELDINYIKSSYGHTIGWVIGHVIDLKKEEIISNEEICLKNTTKRATIEDLKDRLAGSFLIILFGFEDDITIVPDSGAAINCYYDKDFSVFSSNAYLLSHPEPLKLDTDLIQSYYMPESGMFYPFGLTPFIGVNRLIPNFELCVNQKTVTRTDGFEEQPYKSKEEIDKAIDRISKILKKTVNAIAKKHDLAITITAGYDSRMVLAAAKDFLDHTEFYTFKQNAKSVDTYMSNYISEKLHLNHTFLDIKKPNEKESYDWLELCSNTTSGGIWKIHPTLKGINSNSVLLPGISGEVGRAIYWKKYDVKHTEEPISAEEMMVRVHLPIHPKVVEAGNKWIKSIGPAKRTHILDLFLQEIRVGCFHAPSSYGNTHSKLQIPVLAHYTISHLTYRLPIDYKFRQQMTKDICKTLWPELAEIPFNEFVGWRNIPFKAIQGSKFVIKETIRRLMKIGVIKKPKLA